MQSKIKPGRYRLKSSLDEFIAQRIKTTVCPSENNIGPGQKIETTNLKSFSNHPSNLEVRSYTVRMRLNMFLKPTMIATNWKKTEPKMQYKSILRDSEIGRASCRERE